ncbi:DsrE family protein [Haladaptatus halobius]|uniref:DsrE family protein n=1 Tax=Haladaptatus halobius TaxID=2884875 RepID=UPI001D0A5707|nr:DsrE family protein [Haladaptatus halobius]
MLTKLRPIYLDDEIDRLLAINKCFTKQQKRAVADEATSFAEEGVRFKACRSGTEKFNFLTDDFLSGVGTVPAVGGELAKLQANGYTYVGTP